jgi:hypothetical protein
MTEGAVTINPNETLEIPRRVAHLLASYIFRYGPETQVVDDQVYQWVAREMMGRKEQIGEQVITAHGTLLPSSRHRL